MSDNRESVLIYRSIWEAIHIQPKKIQAEAWSSIMEYAFTGEMPDKLSAASKGFFLIVKPLLDANMRRRENGVSGAEHGTKGGRPKKQAQENPIGVIGKNPTGVILENPIGVIETNKSETPLGLLESENEKPHRGYDEKPLNRNRNRNRIKDKEEDINNRTLNLDQEQGQGLKKTPSSPFQGEDDFSDPPDHVLDGKVQGVVTGVLDKALDDFGKYRKAVKKPLTDRGRELVAMKLEKMAPGDEGMQVAILEQSIANGWQGIFPLKSQGMAASGKSGNPFLTLLEEYDAEDNTTTGKKGKQRG